MGLPGRARGGGRGGFGGRGRGDGRGRGRGGFGGPFKGGRGSGGRGGGRGGRGGGGGFGAKRSSNKVVVEPHRHPGIFVGSTGKEDLLLTKNLAPGSSVYGEKLIVVESGPTDATSTDNIKTEYRVWNPFRSKLAAAILSGVADIGIKPGSTVLYLGAASGTTVSHVSDIVGPSGLVYAVEFSTRSGRDLLTVAKKRTNIVPIIDDARHPLKYRMLMGMVDCVFADVAQPDQARILALNVHHYLKGGGHFVISIKASCIDSTAAPEAVFAQEVKKLKQERLKPREQVSLEPFERDHAVVIGIYKPMKVEPQNEQ
ncbi:hypothetical protein ACOME3_000480 [Neoechinorhynchus agilis]